MKREISVTYMSGPLDGKKLTFDEPEAGDELVLSMGRREVCDIHMPFDNQVSRVHARLGCRYLPTSDTASSGSALMTFWLEDAGSRNGTFLERDDEPITARVSLRPGTLFRIGRTWLRLDIPLSYRD